MQEVELQEISGSVEDIVYRNQDTGFAVIQSRTPSIPRSKVSSIILSSATGKVQR